MSHGRATGKDKTANGGDPRRLLSAIPSVDHLLSHSLLENARNQLRRDVFVRLIREELEGWRNRLLEGRGKRLPEEAELAKRIAERVNGLFDGAMRRVLNGTGVILHTGLGRAVLAESALERITEIASGNADLEFRLESGSRGQREERAAEMLSLLTGSEDALVCNNNAAAVSLMLSALCNRKEVIVSRGQQVEIGGGFRIPDVIRRSGAKLVEVGCTNRSHLSDFEEAITPRTAAILRVHPSNYRVIGFTGMPELNELSALCREKGILLLDDLGSGALVDYPGVPEAEPVVQRSLEQGADLVTFSGDKMLGGPQAGLVIGRRELVRKLARHPMMRAFRCDKLVLAALEATLQLYLKAGGDKPQRIPVWQACNEGREASRARAQSLMQHVLAELGIKAETDSWPLIVTSPSGLRLEARDSEARTGSGALPEQDIPSAALCITSPVRSAERLHRAMRKSQPSLVAQVHGEEVIIDVKMLRDHELNQVAQIIKRVVEN
jgi:L-seryl-tRNA(Ser) seleniumtransferase